MDLGKFGGSREGLWKKAMLKIRPQDFIFQLIFVAQVTSNENGHSLAIDDIRVTEGPCPALDTFECTFEDQNICGFKHDMAADFDFIRQNMGTPTLTTGPIMDHTLNNANGYYVRIEANKKAIGSSARLVSPAIQRTHSFTDPSCLGFWYSMYGKHMGYLNVYATTTDTIPTTTTLTEAAMVWSLNGDQGDGWKMAEVAIDMANDFVIIFEALRGDGNKGDAAIDDVQFIHSADCPIPEVSTQPTTDRTTLSSTTTTTTPEVDKSTTHQLPSTISTSGSVQQTTLLDITTAKVSTHPTTSIVEETRTVSQGVIQEHTTITERTTSSLPKSTFPESVKSEDPSERTTDVASTPDGPTAVSTFSNTSTATVTLTRLLETTNPKEHTALPPSSKVSTPESVQSTTSSRHTTKYMFPTFMTSSTALPTLTGTKSPALVSPTTLREHTAPTEFQSRSIISEITTAESVVSTTSSIKTTSMATSSSEGSTTTPTIATAPKSNTPGSGRPTTPHVFTAPIEPSTTLATDSEVNTSESLRSKASSDQTANAASTSIHAPIATTTVLTTINPTSERPTNSQESATPIEPMTLATVSKAYNSMQTTVSTENDLTVSTGNTLATSELGSTGTHSSSDTFDLDTLSINTTGIPSTMTQPEMPENISKISEETLRTLVSTSISNTSTLLSANSSSNYTPSANETTLDPTAVSEAEDGTEATTRLEFSKRLSSATPTKEVSEGPSSGNGSFFQNNKIAVISFGVVLGGLCIVATAALITRFVKPDGTGLSMKHRGHNRVGASEATKLPSMEPSTNTLMMTEKMSGLPSIESVERHNIYNT
eukprot:XP_011671957.1 PREDICTED: cell wall protein DAN4-like [Strongylocentrotus purpuratus]